jgi:predicted DNA binding CopG/RHH family protein
MAITKKPGVVPLVAALDKFIEAAPDGAKPAKFQDVDSVQITLRLSREQLERLTQVAKRQGIPRASYIKRSVFIQLEADEQMKW